MTWTDLIIVVIVGLVVALIIYRMTRKQDQGVCTKCAYAKHCSDTCFTDKKTISED